MNLELIDSSFKYKGNNKKVLVAEDEQQIMNLYKQIFSPERGYDLVTANDGVEALQAIRSDADIGVLVTDLAMPNMNGYDLIRGFKDKMYLPTIIVSGNAGLDRAEVMGELVTVPFPIHVLNKPISMIDLISNVDAYINEKKIYDSLNMLVSNPLGYHDIGSAKMRDAI